VTVPDATGRLVLAKDARPLPEVTGTHRHVVKAGDRLDQLAWSYYGEPLKYWRICDANPAFLSPLALLGQDALATTRFPVSPGDGDPPWSGLLEALAGEVGVADAVVVEEVALEDQRRRVEDRPVTVTIERLTHSVVVTHNRAEVDVRALAGVMGDAGFEVGPPSDSGQVGRTIVVPAAFDGQAPR